MQSRSLIFSVLLLLTSIAQLSCFSASHRIWPQKDIQPNDLNEPSLEKKVLIASRSSEFKDAVVAKIGENFKDEPIYMKFIGLDQLKKEDGTDYAAVVMINTCMARSMDRHVKGFLKRHKDQSHMIVLTTSGDGGWLPKMKDRNFDAVSSASEKKKVDEVADKVTAKIRSLMQEEGSS